MIRSMNDERRFEQLVRKVVDEELTAREAEDLENILRSKPLLLERYDWYLDTYVLLECEGALLAGRPPWGGPGPVIERTRPENREVEREANSRNGGTNANGIHRFPRLYGMAAAAMVLAVGLWWIVVQNRGAVATVIAVSGDEVELGSVIDVGEGLSVVDGTVQLSMVDGVELVLIGPCQVSSVGNGGIRLELGRITARVPDGAEGFSVETPATRIVDLGTQFGVDALSNGSTEVVVLDGVVEVETVVRGDGQEPRNALLVREGQEAVIAADGSVATGPGELDPDRAEAYRKSLRVDYDLGSLVGGGDGIGKPRWRGLDPTNGEFCSPDTIDTLYATHPGRFSPVPDSLAIAGVFVPGGEDGKAVIDPEGGTFQNRRLSGDESFGPFVVGAPAPIRAVVGTRGENQISSVVDGVDYGSAPHRVVFMHSNKGITFDLQKMAAPAELRPHAFSARVGNSEQSHETRPHDNRQSNMSADFWAIVDGRVVYERLGFNGDSGMEEVDVLIPSSARFLTLIAGNGDIATILDWVIVADGKITFVRPGATLAR